MESVQHLSLQSNNIVGTLSSQIFQLPNLIHLNLDDNPDLTIQFDGIEKALKLEVLTIDGVTLASLKGIKNARRLRKLSANRIGFGGGFPMDILAIDSLEFLSLQHNQLTGTLPEGLSKLKHLTVLNLMKNHFGGDVGMLPLPSSLSEIDLSRNQFEGFIPINFMWRHNDDASLSINLSENRIVGTLPSTLTRFTTLNIDLRDNFIEGIDPPLCQMKQWNGGLVGKYGCDALLCPKDYSAVKGKRVADQPVCEPCASALNYGSSSCHREEFFADKEMSLQSGTGGTVLIILMVLISVLVLVWFMVYQKLLNKESEKETTYGFFNAEGQYV